MIPELPNKLVELLQGNRAWLLTLLSSVMCIIGASVIYLDLIVRFFYRSSRFSIRDNDHFLICGFSLSSGSLLLTSLYRLMPKGFQYFKKAHKMKGDDYDGLGANTLVMLTFLAGVVICAVLNEVIHYFTSESIVHCAHGPEDSESEHSHGSSHSHGHSHSHSSTDLDDDDDVKPHLHNHMAHDEESQIPAVPLPTETTPLTTTTPMTYLTQSRKGSLMNIFDIKAQQPHLCQGIYDTNCDGFPCVNEQLTDRVSNDIQNLDFYRGVSLRRTKSSLVAYTEATPDPHGSPVSPIASTSVQQLVPPTDHIISTLPSKIRLTEEPNLDRHARHEDDHHHQITTPVSRLLSIGLQTCLALTLHKFPEGFITYATTKADPKLGLSIFLSLAIHNIVEGFSMALPLYLALNSRIKAFGITLVLGGMSQPIGALLAVVLLKGRELKKDDSLEVFGALMGVTSGFLTVIALQLFASAIKFGGSSNTVIRWCILGALVILLSSTLTD